MAGAEPLDPIVACLHVERASPAYAEAKGAINFALAGYPRAKELLDGYRSHDRRQLVAVRDALRVLVEADRAVEPRARLAAWVDTEYPSEAVAACAATLDGWLALAIAALEADLGDRPDRHRPTLYARDWLLGELSAIFVRFYQGTPTLRRDEWAHFANAILTSHHITLAPDRLLDAYTLDNPLTGIRLPKT